MQLRCRFLRVPLRDDAGQLPIALVVVVFIGPLGVVFAWGLPLGQATDQQASSRTAADAAGLAAADQIKKDLPDDLNDALADIDDRDGLRQLLDFLRPGYGQNEATRFADLNNGEVTSYAFNRGSGEIEVTVEGRAVTAGQHSISRSRTRLGLRHDDCDPVDDDLPTPTPRDPETPPGNDQQPPNVGTELRCGDLVLHFTVNGTDGRPALDSSLDDLADQFDIALIG